MSFWPFSDDQLHLAKIAPENRECGFQIERLLFGDCGRWLARPSLRECQLRSPQLNWRYRQRAAAGNLHYRNIWAAASPQ
jgi:hypothetical protein